MSYDFSLDIPPLTHYLGRILKRYPLGGQILKELLQNAEDSNASVVKFYIDYTEYPSVNLLHPGLKKFQGPALLVFNDSKFDESDFQSIRQIEKSEKYDKPLKIGKFGLGFNSIYHLTDLPTIISGNDLIIFDPHEKYFLNFNNCRRGIRFKIDEQQENSQNFFEKYNDQFAPYIQNGINFGSEEQGKENFLNLKNEFRGSFFRFPIRNKEAAQESKISQEEKSIDKIVHEDILSSFYKDINFILLFLRRL
jgi:sacsin